MNLTGSLLLQLLEIKMEARSDGFMVNHKNPEDKSSYMAGYLDLLLELKIVFEKYDTDILWHKFGDLDHMTDLLFETELYVGEDGELHEK